MIAPRIPTKPLRNFPGLAAHAGRMAKVNDVEWWGAWGYAVATVGTTDATEIMECAIAWLQGWIFQFKRDHPEQSVPSALGWIVEKGTRPLIPPERPTWSPEMADR
jgi:hypothetical protein